MVREDKSNFIAEVSHELRLPLANVKLLVETLLDGALEDPALARSMLMRTKDEVSRLQNLVTDLLSHEKARSAGRFVKVNVADRVDYVKETTAMMAQAKQIQVLTDIEPDLFFRANAEQLDQILLNLVENAIKFTPDKGEVCIKASGKPDTLIVSDTGIGIAPAEIGKIFQRFYRVDRSKTRGSTGLGLSIVKHIVDLHGASINVSSALGKGSSFTIVFRGPEGEANG